MFSTNVSASSSNDIPGKDMTKLERISTNVAGPQVVSTGSEAGTRVACEEGSRPYLPQVPISTIRSVREGDN